MNPEELMIQGVRKGKGIRISFHLFIYFTNDDKILTVCTDTQ